ncbi:MAG: hypothetical protein GX868_18220, partial [Actinobacteria bacterium]|nr:hypothetical protein [Actinomycetota bacterium]
MQPALRTGEAPPLDPRLREILGGAVAVRFLTHIWSAVVLVIDGRSGVLDHPARAFAVFAAMTAWTATTGILVRNRPSALVSPAAIGTDIALALLVSMADTWVYDGSHPQSFGSAWPIAAVLSVGAIAGMIPGGIVGALTGIASLVAAALAGSTDGRWLANSGTILLGAIAGIVAGYVADRLRAAEMVLARARAREEFARDLHDGVLQTLAVIQRRSDDAALVALAREQDRELRAFIGGERRLPSDLVAALHRTAAEAIGRFDVAVDVVVIDRRLPEAVRARLKSELPEFDPRKLIVNATHTHT